MAFFNALKKLFKPQYIAAAAAAAVGCGSLFLIPSAVRYFKSKSQNNDDFHNFNSHFKFGIPGWLEQLQKKTEVSVRAEGKYWGKREDEEGLYLRMECPGVDEEHFKIIKEGEGSLLLRGEVLDQTHSYVVYGGRLHLNPRHFELDSVTVHVLDGVADVVVPKKKKKTSS